LTYLAKLKLAASMIQRNQYKDCWNAISQSEEAAKRAVSGETDEDVNSQSAIHTLEILKRHVGIRPDDVVLEIGAGVGRVGAVLAPLCHEWIGVDVSENMVKHIKRRLAGHNNVRAIATNGFDLSPIPSESVDVVYCTVVFMHLDEWERYGYIAEGFRILRPNGRMLVDNVNLLSDEGWAFFQNHCALPPSKRPPHTSRTSTPQELETYFSHANFVDIRQEHLGIWIITSGSKPYPTGGVQL
jgi:SAM-dependent methyltransferase